MRLAKKTYGYPDILLLPLRIAPAWTVLLILIQLSVGLVPTLEILFFARFLDTATDVLQGGVAMSAVLIPIALVVAAVAWNWCAGQIVELLNARLRLRARATLRTELTERRARLKYRHIESAESWDLIQRVCKEPENQAVEALNNLLGLTALAIRVAGVIALVLINAWWAALIIVAVTIPMAVIAMKGGKASYQAERDVTKIRRRYEYLSEVLMGRDAAPERSLFGYGDSLNEIYKEEFLSAYKYGFRVAMKWFGRRFIGGAVFALIAVMITLVLLPATLQGALSFGLFVSLANSVTSMINLLAWSLGNFVDGIAKRREGLRDLTAFLQLEETDGALDEPGKPIEFESLELRDVTFTYPGTDREILKGMSIQVEKGRHYALVGVNGAGKTTLTKILTGLYDEYGGEIRLNGRDLRSYTQAELKACFSVVYQDFSKYNISVKDNAAFGMPEREKKVSEALSTVGLTQVVNLLPQGLDTPLGKIEGEGQDISGGEWQRLAMARAVLNPAPVRILDEPTSALDPIAESRVYSEFEKISQGRTTMFISHRLGSTALADTIYVLGDGKVIEQGSHDELMAQSGLYAEMYASQRSWYE